MYSVYTFNNQTKEMVFKFLDQHLHTINLKDSNLTQYGSVNPTHHYFDTKTETIVNLCQPNNSRIFNIDNDGVLYRKATQFEFDRWMSQEFPESDNAKVFNILINSTIVNDDNITSDTQMSFQNKNVYSIGDTDSSDDEDPYYRGNLEEYIKGR
jgi:hypothetical protein